MSLEERAGPLKSADNPDGDRALSYIESPPMSRCDPRARRITPWQTPAGGLFVPERVYHRKLRSFTDTLIVDGDQRALFSGRCLSALTDR